MTVRRLGLIGSTAIGLASMLGAGLFVVFPEAARAAGSWVVVSLGVAGAVALCNAWSSARLAARMPRSGGAYVYGRERLGIAWGWLAGTAFIVGKIGSCATMALAIGLYAWPDHHRLGALFALVAVTLVNLAGIERSATVAVVIAGIVIVTVSVVLSSAEPHRAAGVLPDGDALGVLHAAALLFFAFAGYARLATLGGEVKRPTVTIPRAIALSVAIVAIIYTISLLVLVDALGADLPSASAPFIDILAPGSALRPVVSAVTAISIGGALLSLTLGVSRTASAMADDGALPRVVGTSNRHGTPWLAEIGAAVAAAVLVTRLDVGDAVVLSSVCVLLYYAIANAAAWTLGGRLGRFVAALGLGGCLILGSTLVIN